jgi:hypothetical protein
LNEERQVAILKAKPVMIDLSIDAATGETLKKIRPTLHFEKVVQHASSFLDRIRKTPPWGAEICVQFVVMKQNAHEVRQWADFWLPKIEGISGAKLYIKPVFAWPRITDSSAFYPSPGITVPPHPNILVVPRVGEVRRTCRLLWEFCYIHSDGAYIPCCMCSDDLWKVGNVFESSLVSCYNSPKMQQYRKAFSEGRYKDVPLCDRCV